MGSLLVLATTTVLAGSQLLIQGLDIRPGASGSFNAYGPYVYISKGASGGYAPLYLPAGAVITDVRLWAAAQSNLQKLRVSIDSAPQTLPLDRSATNVHNISIGNLTIFDTFSTQSAYRDVLRGTVEIAPDRLYWIDLHTHPSNNDGVLIGHIVVDYDYDLR